MDQGFIDVEERCYRSGHGSFSSGSAFSRVRDGTGSGQSRGGLAGRS
ncbi:hypothetical protein SMF913_27360 [Streptomyces malaysiensis]|uniref:Uncharacterized protein n=1 Tax=Streptomyces malaysiensis TaxID=92644 RepID=A0A2J7YV38_STRMQ|nr:hypothetical protein SMF913_27360 [Streptomyces malaysiensis]